jgi:hypothetical protein
LHIDEAGYQKWTLSPSLRSQKPKNFSNLQAIRNKIPEQKLTLSNFTSGVLRLCNVIEDKQDSSVHLKKGQDIERKVKGNHSLQSVTSKTIYGKNLMRTNLESTREGAGTTMQILRESPLLAADGRLNDQSSRRLMNHTEMHCGSKDLIESISYRDLLVGIKPARERKPGPPYLPNIKLRKSLEPKTIKGF